MASRYSIFLLLFILIGKAAFSQEDQLIDSLIDKGNYKQAINRLSVYTDSVEMKTGRLNEAFAKAYSLRNYLLHVTGDDPVTVKNRYDTVLTIRQKINGKKSIEVADVLMDLSATNSSLGNSNVAEKLLKKSLKIRQRLLNDTDKGIIACKINYAVMLNDKKRFLEGSKILLELCDTSKYYNTPLSLKISVFENLAKAYRGLNELEKQESVLLDAYHYLEITIDEGELPDISQTIRVFNSLGEIYNSRMQFEKADSINFPAFELSNNLGANSELFHVSLNNLFNTYMGLGKYENAKNLILQYINNPQLHHSQDSIYYINNLDRVGKAYAKLNLLDSSNSYFSKAENSIFSLKSTEKKSDLKSLSEVYMDWANSLYNNNNFSASIVYYKKAVEIRKQIAANIDDLALYYTYLIDALYRASHFNEFTQLITSELTPAKLGGISVEEKRQLNKSIAVAFFQKGRFQLKNQHYDSSIATLKTALEYVATEPSSLKANIFFSLGQASAKRGNRVDALNNFKFSIYNAKMSFTGDEFIEFLVKSGNSNIDDFRNLFFNKVVENIKFASSKSNILATYNDLSNFYVNINDFTTAEKLLLNALSLADSLYSTDSNNIEITRTVGILLSNYGRVLRNKGEYSSALFQYKRALTIKDKGEGNRTLSYASTLDKIGIVYRYLKERDSAFYYTALALKIRESLDTNQNVDDLIDSYINIGVYFQEEKILDSSKKFFLKALKICNRKKSDRLIVVLNDLCNIYYDEGDIDNYVKSLSKLLTEIISGLEKAKSALSFDQYHSMCNQFQYMADINIGRFLESHYGNDELNRIFANYILWKTQNEFRNIKIGQGENKDLSLRLRKIRSDISTCKMTGNINSEEFAHLNYIRDSVEREISLARILHPIYRDDWQSVHNKISKDEIAIHFFSFPFYKQNDRTDSNITCAIIFSQQSNSPEILYFFERRQIDSLLSISGEYNTSVYRQHDLYKILLKPIESHLRNIHNVFISSSGLLNNVNWSAILLDTNKTLGEIVSVHNLSNTLDIISYQPTYLTPQAVNQAVVYGGVDYDKATQTPLNNVNDENNVGLPQVNEIASRGALMKFGYLPGTKDEAGKIVQLCSNKNIATILMTGEDATEVSIKRLSGKEQPFILHIATHGYFFPDPVKSKYERQSQDYKTRGNDAIKLSNDPLLRSGLIFAGANHSWANPNYVSDGTEDGILTSYEISNLDLSNCQLVVLSACETGLGDIKGSEGVFGLQRAFKIAGVKNIIMSLWKVPDVQTSELMTSFYNYCFAGKSVHDALQAAQVEMKKKYPPYYWAGFKLLE